ncbi:hypothetical protein D5b_00228 [Faustovirus]|nr:hypothetical protein D5b_00228 [Faustovirus]AMN84686.1 hypothetical protein D6_00283 [Faustovirus]AMP44180.1 hypothetical protein PRJ_Dakar_00224 [Faustovirus]
MFIFYTVTIDTKMAIVNDRVYAFEPSDDESESDELEPWDGIHRCSGCKTPITEQMVMSEIYKCDECFKVLNEYVELGLDYMQRTYPEITCVFKRNAIITISGPSQAKLKKAVMDFQKYLSINDGQEITYESKNHKYSICMDTWLIITKKPRLKPARYRESINITREN